MTKYLKYNRRSVEIDQSKYLILKTYAVENGKKLYVVIDDVLEAGMKRKRIMPDGEGAGTSVPLEES